MRLRSFVFAGGLIAMLVVMVAGTTFAQGTTPTDRTFYLRNDGSDCESGNRTYLADTAGAGDLRCGHPAGLPFGEVYDTVGQDIAATYVTQTPFAVGLDASRDLNGRITVAPHVEGDGQTGSGTGQIVVEVYGTALTSTNTTVDLGSSRVETVATPLQSRQSVLYAMPIPDELNGLEVTQLTLRVKVRGAHISHGFTQLNGASHVNLPFLSTVVSQPDPEPEPSPTP